MNEDSITRIYCDVDDFCKALERYCKSHLIINDRGEICSFCLTAGNIDDRNIDIINFLCGNWAGNSSGTGYISQELFERFVPTGNAIDHPAAEEYEEQADGYEG